MADGYGRSGSVGRIVRSLRRTTSPPLFRQTLLLVGGFGETVPRRIGRSKPGVVLTGHGELDVIWPENIGVLVVHGVVLPLTNGANLVRRAWWTGKRDVNSADLLAFRPKSAPLLRMPPAGIEPAHAV